MRKKCLFLLVVCLLVFQLAFETFAAPNGKVNLTTNFRRIEVGKDQSIRLDIYINNTGREERVIDLVIEKPNGWEAVLRSGGYVVKSIYLGPRERRYLTLEATPKSVRENQTYTFKIKAVDEHGYVVDTLSIQVVVTGKSVAFTGISLSTPYPSIEGPSGRDFEFTVTVKNGEDAERVIDFSALHPPQWLVTFKPRYEEKQIRSLSFKEGETKTISVTVSPPPNVQPGTYGVTVAASSGPLRKEIKLNVTITGTYSLELATSNDLLNINAVQGEEAYITLIVKNTGTGTLEKIHFSSDKPVGWDVRFEPGEISAVPAGDSREVRVTVKPPSDAIPGDYLVTLRSTARPYGSTDSLEIRVTVLRSVAWGLIGAAIIIVTVLALFFIFWRLGRR